MTTRHPHTFLIPVKFDAMLVYAERKSNRLIYVLQTLLREGLGIEFSLTTDLAEFNAHEGPRLNYSIKPVDGAFVVKPHTVLFDHGIRDYHLEVVQEARFHKIFFRNNGGNVPFDLFAASFWLISRYEEYLPYKGDNYNRYQASSSLAYQYEFLQVPIVNLWLDVLGQKLREKFPSIQIKRRQYNYVTTIDIDNVFKYRGKGFVRTMAGFVADKTPSKMKARFDIISGRKKDPFDNYDQLIELHTKYGVESIFFFLLGDYGPNDKNHSASDLRFQSLIKHLADYAKVGIHPSFGSNTDLQRLKVEFFRLGNITHRLITRSRQHFSMLKFPATYQNLIQAGITSDHSMGYNGTAGFRASYCFPYKWYDLDVESVSALNVHPFCMSDHVLLHMPDNASNMLTHLSGEVKKYGGEMITLFHNETLCEETLPMYEQMLAVCRP